MTTFGKQRGRRGWMVVCNACIAAALAACVDGNAISREGRHGVSWDSFSKSYQVIDTLLLEEADNVVSITPMIVDDRRGTILAIETREHQVRLYSERGSLRGVIGGNSGVFDSLRSPMNAHRLRSGEIVVPDERGKVVVVTPGLDSTRVVSTPIVPLMGVYELDDGQWILMGRDRAFARSWLHLWDTDRQQVSLSFFSPPQGMDSNLVRALGGPQVAVRTGLLAALYQLSDTVVIYTHSGAEVRRLHVPVPSFRAPQGKLPALRSSIDRQKWVDQLTFLTNLFWATEAELAIQWVRGSGANAAWGIVRMDTTGRVVETLPNTPRLLGVSGEKYFFQADDHQGSRNRILVAVPVHK